MNSAFQNGCYCDKDVFVLHVVQFWSDILVILNLIALGARPILKSRVWQDQIAPTGVQLRSTIILYIYLFSTDLLSGEINMTNGTAYVQ